jgi:antitoxin component YwqK of YwqJK toxin-antitoxin module
MSRHPNGQVADSLVYVNGKLHGSAVWYDESGHLIKKVEYDNGVRIRN